MVMRVFRLRTGLFAAICLLCVVGTVCLHAVASGTVQNRPMIILDAGHGGVDPGAVSSDGVSEKNINLHIVLKLRDMLETAGFDVLLTREEDVSLHDPQYRSISQIKTSDLKNRLKLINEHPDALVISVHQNFYGQSKYSGAQMFAGPQNEESLCLAESLQSAFCTYLQPENTRQVKTATKDVYIIYYAECPTVLAECGFLSNPEECAKLKTDAYQTQIALTLFQGILQYTAGQ
ncbi:MAG: N-acetylmuramoyl-L-alanine amidase [Oscillospiraceae bacterium]|nr:N-acetylmuramoyl-L-alanine amidase [Oscillospiraceae bacterium]